MSFDKIQNYSDLLFFSSDEYLQSMSKAEKIHRIFYKTDLEMRHKILFGPLKFYYLELVLYCQIVTKHKD